LVPLYRERGDAENPFDELKSYFQVRPVFQCKSERIINYGRICSLAYWISDRVARQWRLCGETGEVTRILYQLQTILLGVIHIKNQGLQFLKRITKVPGELNAQLAKLKLLSLFAAPQDWAETATPTEA